MAKLPKTPTGKELEDFVAALFQTSEFFVEKNIQEEKVLELDAVVTVYDGGKPEPFLVEVKSGDWGYRDIFKVLGWMTYLGLPRGVFVVRDPDLPAFFGPPITGEQRQSARLSRSRVLLGQREPASPASAHRHPSQHGAAL